MVNINQRLKKLEKNTRPAAPRDDRQAVIRAAFDRLSKAEFQELADADSAYHNGQITASELAAVCNRLLGLEVFIE